jgi:mono/diheme cytochrome c family protein
MTIFRAVSIVVVVIVVGIVAGAFYVFYDSSMHAEDKGPPSGPVTAALIERGEYLTRAADCAACHTVPNGKPFAGGFPFKLPFGTIYSMNITADRETGIGSWSDDDFVRALHRGIAPGGRYLYPAFPYTSFTAMSRDDALAIKAYLFSLPPQNVANRRDNLSFPFNQRWGMAFWNLAFLRDRRFTPDPNQSDVVNRGAYMATALGHCGQCHTPRNLAYALENNRQFAGEMVVGWKAYDITPGKQLGIGAWSDAQLVSYLSSAHADGRGSAAGPMALAVQDSLQFLTPGDIDALVAYLRSIPAQASRYGVIIASAYVPSSSPWGPNPPTPQTEVGLRIFADGCANCHEYNGNGRQTPYAALIGSASVNDPDGASMTQVMLKGVMFGIKDQKIYMPPLGREYSDAELAAVANYVIAHFSGKTGHVTPQDVAKRRRE